jgi:GNAT superfamily N-acetyltransferase
MTATPRIRRATADDLETVLELWLEAADWIFRQKGIHQWKPNSFTLTSVIDHFNKTELFVAEAGETILGAYSVQWSDETIWGERDDEASGYVHRLVVGRAHAGQGLGALLLNKACEYIYGQGKQRVRVDCMADNVRLNEYYVQQGFAYQGRIDKPYFSASLYEKQRKESDR